MHKIMILDDEENVLHALRRILSRNKDWEVVACNDVQEAINIAGSSRFDLFISDYRMPRMNGVEFLVFSKQNNPYAMRLILSGATDFGGLVNAINQAEIYRFMNKPVQADELIFTVKQALQHHDLVKDNRQLADQVRKQQNELKRRKAALKKLAEEHPAIAQVNWGPDGAIVLDEEYAA